MNVGNDNAHGVGIFDIKPISLTVPWGPRNHPSSYGLGVAVYQIRTSREVLGITDVYTNDHIESWIQTLLR